MKDRYDSDELRLPPELAELDAELRSIAWEERSSFGPELHAELEREWTRARDRTRIPVRQLMAAGVAGLLMVGLGVPSARASLIRLIESLQQPEPPASVVQPPPSGGPLFYESPPVEVTGEEEYEGPSTVPAVPPPVPEPTPRSGWVGPAATLPRLHDRDRLQAIIAENYPRELQEAGVGGTVRLLLWVDSAGAVDFVNVGQSSGEPALDRAALEVAPTFRFEPARRWGHPVGTWVEFDMVFEPRPPERDQTGDLGPPPRIVPVDEPDEPGDLEAPVVSAWRGGVLLPSPVRREAGELLRAALADDEAVERLGPIDAILEGNPPPGEAPTAWRSAVTAALEQALVNDPDNPAPLLALARIRRKQGLRDEARSLVDRGLERVARQPDAVSPSLQAELHYERGTLLRERWMAVRAVGWLPADSLRPGLCPAARSAAGSGGGARASVDRIIAWNFLCPARLGAVLDRAFQADDAAGIDARKEMLAAFAAAVTAHPAHVGANVELLLALAEEGSWEALAHGARQFAWASRGHPHALLLGGLALHRLGREAEAEAQLEEALAALPPSVAESLLDVGVLLPPAEASLRGGSPEERQAWRREFWRPLDPVLSTPVNERELEHLVRAAWAHLRFGGVDGDPGRVWIRYGEPNTVRVLDEGAGLRTELWDYGQGPDVTFRRFPSSGAMDLTPEGRAYVDDLVNVFPHRYGPTGREVFALAGEVTRYRGGEDGATDLELRVPFPPILASGTTDSVEVSVFLVDGAARILSRARRTIATGEESVFFRLTAPVEATRVVVEFHDRAGGRTAAMSEEVAADAVHGAPGISDLLVTHRAVPDRQAVRRGASWIRPLSLDGPVDEPVVGAFFELYGMRKATSWYRLRAELESLDTGERVGIPVRPAGEDGYRATWDRLAGDDGVAGEYVGLALGNVPRGRYTLRVVVDFPLAGGPLVAERVLTLS